MIRSGTPAIRLSRKRSFRTARCRPLLRPWATNARRCAGPGVREDMLMNADATYCDS